MVIRALDRKLVRDLIRMKAQVAAIALVIASGVAVFVAMTTMYQSVRRSQDVFYTQWRFADVWSGLARAPLRLARDIAALPEVAGVDARLMTRATLSVPRLMEPASALILSVPGTNGHAVNDVYVRRGRHIEPGRPGEVLVSEGFVEKNHLQPGDSLTAVIAGRRVTLHLVGVALSPEYVMPIEPGSIVPDDRRFAILWMARDQLEILLGMQDEFNDVAVRLVPGADEHRSIEGLDRVLAPYGGLGAYGRRSQGSHVMLEEHLQMLPGLALLVPTIFLLVAAFLVNIVVGRLVAQQREQIGMLKAFGYANGQIARHYVVLTLSIVILGVAAGLPIGIWLAGVLVRFYGEFFRFPVLVFEVELPVVVGAIALAATAAVAGVLGVLRRIVALPPTVAMAAEVPSFRHTLLDRTGLTQRLAPSSHMMFRNLTRRPLRSALSSGGMVVAIAVVILGRAVSDGSDRMRDVQFQAALRHDVAVTLANPRAVGTVRDFRALPGVTRAEPYRLVPARLLVRGSYEDITLVGLPDEGTLRRAVGADFHRAPSPGGGVVLTAWTAHRLGLVRGDLLSIEIRERQRPVVTAPLTGIVNEPLGEQGYMELGALGRLLGEPDTYSGANLAIDPALAPELYTVLKGMPQAVAVDLRRGVLARYRAMGDAATSFIRTILVLFAVIIAFGVVYNTARITVSERARELATLRVLGFTRAEVSAVLLGEIAMLAAPAIPLGFALGFGLTGLVVSAITGSRMHVPLLVSPSTYAFALVVFMAASLVSALVARRRLDRMDLITVLKARE